MNKKSLKTIKITASSFLGSLGGILVISPASARISRDFRDCNHEGARLPRVRDGVAASWQTVGTSLQTSARKMDEELARR